MFDDWENDDFFIPHLSIPTAEQLKQLEDRRLVEESDAAITKDLFNICEDKVNKEIDISNITTYIKKVKHVKKCSNQNKNEERNKALSKKIKEDKARKAKEIELYGETEYDNPYANYEDKYY
jgi:hypothetical protein